MIWIIALILSVFLEVNCFAVPLTFGCLLFWTVTSQRAEVFAGAFFAGIFLDLLTFNSVGITSAFFILAILAVFLYRSKFEIKTLGFVGVVGVLGSFIYMVMHDLQYLFWGSILMGLILIISFKIYQTDNLKFEFKSWKK